MRPKVRSSKSWCAWSPIPETVSYEDGAAMSTCKCGRFLKLDDDGRFPTHRAGRTKRAGASS